MKYVLTFITLCTTISHVYAMELVNIKNKKTHQTNDKIDYFKQLPVECIEQIIFYNTPKAVGAIKNTCKYLASLASILKVHNSTFIHNFINDEKTRSHIFKKIIATDDPIYIEKLLDCCRRETQSLSTIPQDSVIITIDKTISPIYLSELLTQAIKENKFNATITILKECPTLGKTWLHYAAKYDSDLAIQALLLNSPKTVNLKNSDNETALDIALRKDNKKAIAALTFGEKEENKIQAFKKARSEDDRECCTAAILVPCLLCIMFGGMAAITTGMVIGSNTTL